MGKKFLSFLGTGNYGECTYKCTNGSIKTRFIQRALIDDLCKDWSDEDEVVIFVTEKSKKVNWESIDKEIEKREKINENQILITKDKVWTVGLKDELQQNFGNNSFKIKEMVIPEGRNLDEIWNIFELMMKSIDKGDEVIFDITHSFRSIPMLALVVLNYAKVIKEINILGIYYGAYEAKDENGVAPVFDLKEFDRLLEWSYAVNSFVKFGDSRQILDLVNKSRKNDEDYRDIYKFSQRLNSFTSTIMTCRGLTKDDGRKSVQAAYRDMKKALNEIKNKSSLPPFIQLLNLVENRTDSFREEDNFKTGLAFVKWSIDNNLIQQGYTALDETIKTYICRINNLNETVLYDREEIVAKATAAYFLDEKEWIVNSEENKLDVKKVIENTPKEILKIANQ